MIKPAFFLAFFFLLNHYLYCKKNEINFKIESKDWMFKYNLGWDDYFLPIQLNYNTSLKSKICNHGIILEDFEIYDYINAIQDVYRYNDSTILEVDKTYEKLGITKDTNYDSIFIRRGDKLIHESKFVSGENYVEYLLRKTTSTVIFLQTNDYNAYIEIKSFIKKNKLNIRLLTLCEPHEQGHCISKNNRQTFIQDNKGYYDNNNDKMSHVLSFSFDHMKKHVLKMICGIELIRNSTICVLDYQSNVSRFIKLFHKTPENVYDIKDYEFNMRSKVCPAYPESIYSKYIAVGKRY